MTEGRESFTEWGVRWPDGAVAADGLGEDYARGVHDGYPGSVLVCRTVTRTPWREVPDA